MSDLVLAIDTATAQVGVALAGPDGPIASLQVHEGRRHGEVLAPAIDHLCRLAGVELADVACVAVDVGPGLFTGLRVGLATAAALADALGRPALGVTSTDVLAAAHADAGRPVAAVVDIRRGQVAWALHRPGPTGLVEVRPPAVADPADLAGELAGEAGVLVVGDGALRHAHALAGLHLAGPVTARPSAAVLAAVAAGRLGRAGDPRDLSPLYLRDADVRIGWAQAPARG